MNTMKYSYFDIGLMYSNTAYLYHISGFSFRGVFVLLVIAFHFEIFMEAKEKQWYGARQLHWERMDP